MPRRQAGSSSGNSGFERDYTPSSSYSGATKAKTGTPGYIKILHWALWGALGCACILNIMPYEKGARLLFGSGIFEGLIPLTQLPLIGGVFQFIGWISGLFSFGVGIIAWACFQIPELLLLLLLFNQNFLKKFIQKAQSGTREQINKTDYASVKFAKVAHNRLNTELLVTLMTIGGVAYLLDILFCNFINPPVGDGSVGSFLLMMNYLATGQTDLVNWGAVMTNLIVLVAVETIVLSLLYVRKLIKFIGD